MKRVLEIFAGVILIPALVIMFSECNDLSMTWLRLLAAGYCAMFAFIKPRGAEYER